MRVVKDIVKLEVIDENAMIVGKVSDVIIDTETFEITDLVLKKSGLNNAEDILPIDRVRVIGEKIILKAEFDF